MQTGTLRRCYSCGNGVPTTLEDCPSCGASQSQAAAAMWRTLQRATREKQFWRFLSFLALGLGLIGGLAWGGFGMTAASSTGIAGARPLASQSPLTAAAVNDAFIRIINDDMVSRKTAPFEILSWVPAADGGIAFELRPPTADNPLTLWQVLDQNGRIELMKYLSVTLLRAQIEGGTFANNNTAFPPIVLQYRGDDTPLAARYSSGDIKILATRWDAAYAEFFAAVRAKTGATTTQPTVPGTPTVP